MQSKDHTEDLGFQKYWLILKRRWLPATGVFSAIMALAALMTVLQKPTYRATASLLVKVDRSSSAIGLTGTETDDLQALTTTNSSVETQAEIVRSEAIAEATIQALDLKDEKGRPLDAEAITQELTVKNIPSTDVLQISYGNSDPYQAAKVVNKIIEVYIKNNIAANRAETAAAREFLSKQILRVEASVQDAESALRKFKEENQIVALNAEAEAAVNTIASLNQKLADSQADLAKATARIEALRNQLRMDSRQAGPLRDELTSKLLDAEAERLSLINQNTALQQTLTMYQNRASLLPGLAQTQSELERKLAAAQSTYETLLTRMQEIQVAENHNIGNARVISNASIPKEAAGPSKNLYLMAGGAAGLVLALSFALLLDLCDRSIKTVQEAKELFGYTLLGLIPAYGRLITSRKSAEQPIPKIFPRDMPRSEISEAYHMLQANLKFFSSDQEIRVVVVTSSVAKEGKSTIAANLAAAAAQVGRRVLLVDADMRCPQQHHIWDLINSGGLSNVIVGQQDLNTAVQSVMSGLDILPAGIIPPNPLALLDSKRMASLVETFSATYDLVVLDTPPLVGIVDAAILGKISNGMLLVVRPGVVDSNSAATAKEFLTQSGQVILGLVANDVPTDQGNDSYFYNQREQLEADFLPINPRFNLLTSVHFGRSASNN